MEDWMRDEESCELSTPVAIATTKPFFLRLQSDVFLFPLKHQGHLISIMSRIPSATKNNQKN